MIRRFSGVVAIAALVAAFGVMFWVLSGSTMLIQLGGSAAVAAAVGFGVHLMLAPSDTELQQVDYQEDARARVRAALADLSEANRAAARARDPRVRAALERASRTVPELLDRIAETQPTSLYSSAAQIGGHVKSLRSMIVQYAEIEQHPDYYSDAPRLLNEGREAVERFDRFTIDSIRLVNQGDMAEYQANLDTVAPPELPKLEG